MLGSGGFGIVYKGILNGSFVAIKKLTEVAINNSSYAYNSHQQDGALALTGGQVPDSFSLSGQLACEIRALTRYNNAIPKKCKLAIFFTPLRCRHRNLVDLMGFCLSPPMLVYEYMERGNLYDQLFKVASYIVMILSSGRF